MHRVSVLAFFLVILLGTSGLAYAEPSDAVPAAIGVPTGHFSAFQLEASGVQIYTCQARADDPAVFEWTFRAPQASLTGPGGESVGTHYAGPTWEGLDGSKVIGTARATFESPDPNAIPWLLLEAQAHDGSGIFSTVSYVQRLATSGGRAPTGGCEASSVGQEARVPYAASYAYSYPTVEGR